MKTKILCCLSCLILVCMLFTGCSPAKGSKNYENNANLVNIKNELYYYVDTGIVYIVFNEASGYKGYGYMSPYYSENGNLCRYDVNTNSIVEIKD